MARIIWSPNMFDCLQKELLKLYKDSWYFLNQVESSRNII